jgi:hypothetical protein
MFRNSQSAEEKVKSGGGRKRTVLQRTRGDKQQDSKFLRELAVDKTFVQVRKQ